MELFRLILKNTMRHPLRSILTVFGIAIAISAFGLIRTVIGAWYSGVEASAPNRLITRNAVSLGFSLPVAYREAIRGIPGVVDVTYAHWFGGIYIDEKHSQFPQFAVDTTNFSEMYPEFKLPPEQKAVFKQQRNAAVVGRKLAERFNWKVGDVIQMRGMIFPGDWEFTIRGIYTGAQKSTDETQFIFHYQYLDEKLKQTEPWRAGNVGWYVVKVKDPRQAAEVAEAIDLRFKNSLAETLTETERAFVLGFISMSETILVALRIISLVIIGVILLVLSNTMAMTARERLSEYAVLKTLGFGARHLVFLIVGESLLIAATGGLVGILITYPAAKGFERAMGDAMGAIFPAFDVATTTQILCALMAVAVGLAASAFPTWRAVQVRIVDGLRRVG
ncbi:MAG: ABC transporter permease [Nitrospirae bacterium]|nr:ABC transporter permease [Candidatus Manganitrophaceae bacterium]